MHGSLCTGKGFAFEIVWKYLVGIVILLSIMWKSGDVMWVHWIN